MGAFSELMQYRNLIDELVVRDIKKKYRRSILGIVWSLLNPLLMMVITAMVFSTLFRFDIGNYALYLLSGQIIFTFYAEATSFAMGSILENGSLIKKVYIPKYLFPISRVASSGVNLLLTIPAMIVIMVVTGAAFSWHLIFFIVPLILLFFFALGIGLILSAMSVYFRDMFHLYGVLLTALNYATPIFYPVKIIPPEYRFITDLNPLAYYLQLFRQVVYENQLPSLSLTLGCALISIVAMILGIVVFKRSQNKFILYV